MRSIQFTLFALLIASSEVYADMTFNLTPGVSPISRDVYELHMTVFWICVVIGIIVFGVMFFSMFYHRKSRGAKAASFHSHPWLEITWTIIPVLILIAMAIPATRVLLNMNNTDQEALTIKITGYQWKWHYDYLEDHISFFSNLSTPADQLHNQARKGKYYLREVDHPLVVPIHKKIRFLVTSNDVNHAWWVPDLGVKRDAIAGLINEAWTIIDKPGTYRGQCAELCGINHAYMPIVVIATTDQGYQDWVAQQKGQAAQGAADVNKQWTQQELMKQGEQIYSRICIACHQPGGAGLPPTFPGLKGSKIATGPIKDHVNIVFNGKAGTAMQAFKNQLSDVELASIITYERNAFGNNTNTLVQPVQIKALREGKSIEEALTTQPVAASTTTASNAAPVTTKPAAPASPSPAPSKSAAPAPVATAPSPAKPAPVATTSTSAVTQQPVSQGAPKPASTPALTPASAPAADELKAAMARGEKIYLGICAMCHQVEGTGMPPTFPALKGSAIATGPVAGHINRVMNGKPGTAMQAFKEQMNDQDIADVITYERNAWGNNTGTLVTPAEIKAAREQSQK